ncbi:MAG TPA: HD domain-containing phosphohydrolase [Gaiellaceae bacterium]|nr:HD domain-containing phosphohydrolase [Gaiellaceae bacterium]
MGEPQMLDAFEPPRDMRVERLAKHARKVAARRSQTLEIPDAHALRVATLSAEISDRIGLLRHEVETVVEGALLHDLGKARVPKAILDVDRALTDSEYATVKKHPSWGAALVEGFVPPNALLAIRHHHERWDGTGYPSGLAGHDIPIEARIVGIADAFVAMREERAYRAAKTTRDAVAELHRSAGAQFDPHLVDPLVESVVAEERPPLRLVSRLH